MAVLGCGGAVLSYRLENDRLFYSCVFIRGGLFLATALYEIKGGVVLGGCVFSAAPLLLVTTHADGQLRVAQSHFS